MSQNILHWNEDKSEIIFVFLRGVSQFYKSSLLPVYKCQIYSSNSRCNIWHWSFIWETSYKCFHRFKSISKSKSPLARVCSQEGHSCFYIILSGLLQFHCIQVWTKINLKPSAGTKKHNCSALTNTTRHWLLQSGPLSSGTPLLKIWGCRIRDIF